MIRHVFQSISLAPVRRCFFQRATSGRLPNDLPLLGTSLRPFHSTDSCALPSNRSQKRKKRTKSRRKPDSELHLQEQVEKKTSKRSGRSGRSRKKASKEEHSLDFTAGWDQTVLPSYTDQALGRLEIPTKKREAVIGSNILSLATLWTEASSPASRQPMVQESWTCLTSAARQKIDLIDLNDSDQDSDEETRGDDDDDDESYFADSDDDSEEDKKWEDYPNEK
jgi:hypothetical protein